MAARANEDRSRIARRESHGPSDILRFANSVDEEMLFKVFPEQRESSFGKLLITAVECFAENGFHGTSTREIARRAKLSSAALYVHFKTKTDLLYKITLLMAQVMLADLRNTDDAEKSPGDRLSAIVYSYVKSIAEMAPSVRVATFEFQALNPDQKEIITDLRHDVNMLFEEVLEAGVKSGDFDIDNLAEMRLAILSLCVTVCLWYNSQGDMSPEALAKSYVKIALRMVAFRGV